MATKIADEYADIAARMQEIATSEGRTTYGGVNTTLEYSDFDNAGEFVFKHHRHPTIVKSKYADGLTLHEASFETSSTVNAFINWAGGRELETYATERLINGATRTSYRIQNIKTVIARLILLDLLTPNT